MLFDLHFKSHQGLFSQLFWVATISVFTLIGFSSCSKDKNTGLSNDVAGDYSGINLLTSFGTGNIDMKISSTGPDAISIKFLTDFHHESGPFYSLIEDEFSLNLTTGPNGRISMTMPAKMMTILDKGTNGIKGATVEASGTFVPNPNGGLSGSTLLLSFSIVGVIDPSRYLVNTTYVKQ